jgi:hypothetical protein
LLINFSSFPRGSIKRLDSISPAEIDYPVPPKPSNCCSHIFLSSSMEVHKTALPYFPTPNYISYSAKPNFQALSSLIISEQPSRFQAASINLFLSIFGTVEAD